MLQGTDRISRDPPDRPRSGGTSHDGTHRAPPDSAAHRRSSGPSLTGGFAVRPAQAVLRPPPTPTRPAIHFPGSPVIGRHAPVTLPQVTGPGRASPVPAAAIDAFRAPYAGESLTAAPPGSSPLPWPSPRFREARHSLARPEGRLSNDAAGFASCYGPHHRSPCRAFDAGLRPRPFPDEAASLLPGLLAATRTGLPPAGDDELTNTRKHHALRHGAPPVLLGARIRLTASSPSYFA